MGGEKAPRVRSQPRGHGAAPGSGGARRPRHQGDPGIRRGGMQEWMDQYGEGGREGWMREDGCGDGGAGGGLRGGPCPCRGLRRALARRALAARLVRAAEEREGWKEGAGRGRRREAEGAMEEGGGGGGGGREGAQLRSKSEGWPGSAPPGYQPLLAWISAPQLGFSPPGGAPPPHARVLALPAWVLPPPGFSSPSLGIAPPGITPPTRFQPPPSLSIAPLPGIIPPSWASAPPAWVLPPQLGIAPPSS